MVYQMSQPRVIADLAFPNREDGPTYFLEFRPLAFVAHPVAVQLRSPKIEAALWHPCEFAVRIGMLVPHTAMYEHDQFPPWENQVRPNVRDAAVKTVAESGRMEGTSDGKLRSGVVIANP